MVRLAQTMHLSCVEVNTISKRTETSFPLHLCHLGYHQLHPNWFLILWHIWCKGYTYLASRLTLSPNSTKWAHTWPTSPRSSIECAQKQLQSRLHVHIKPCIYLASRLIRSPNGLKRASTSSTSCRSTIRSIVTDLWAYGAFSANRASILCRD